MQEFIIGFMVVLTGICMQILVALACAQIGALRRHRGLLILLGLMWTVAPLLKKFYIDTIWPPLDGLLHEENARAVARILVEGSWWQVEPHIGVGNKGYRFMLGVAYALTEAPEVMVYMFHSLLAFWGLLKLLELICLHTRASRVSVVHILLIIACPSALFWSTANLKEGPVLWGICMLMTAMTPASRSGKLLQPAAGGLVVCFLRPHIAAAWLAGIGISSLVRQGNLFHGVVAFVAVIGGLSAVRSVKPEIFEQMEQGGYVETMGDRYEKLTLNGDGSVINHGSTGPIPIVSGLILILFRPFPYEVFDARSALAGLEIWCITGLGILGWIRVRGRSSVVLDPFITMCIVSLVCISLHFSYMYNMGAMVRHRIQVYPALFALAVYPALVRLRQESYRPAASHAPAINHRLSVAG